MKDRLPHRTKHYENALMFLGIGIILGITFIFWFLVPLFFSLAIYQYFKALRYPVLQLQCPKCHTKQKIEPMITRFLCVRCQEIIKKENDVWSTS